MDTETKQILTKLILILMNGTSLGQNGSLDALFDGDERAQLNDLLRKISNH